MKTLSLAIPLLLVSLMPAARAETFVLKDGSTVVGRIIRQDAASYVVEVNVTRSIKDEKTIAKSNVAKIEQEEPEITAFAPIAKLVPTPDLMTRDEYDQRIRIAEKYLADYRGSAKTRETKAIIATLKSEESEVAAGGIKLNGKIVPPAEYRANAYDIDARILETKIRSLINGSQYLPALRSFADMEHDYRYTKSFAALLPLIQQVITTYLAETGALLSSYDARIKERETGLARMSNTDRRRTEIAIQEETSRVEKQFKAETDAKVGWITVDPYCKPTLEQTLTFGKAEQVRLAALKVDLSIDAGKLYYDAVTMIQGKGDATAIMALLTKGRTLIGNKYLAKLEALAPVKPAR